MFWCSRLSAKTAKKKRREQGTSPQYTVTQPPTNLHSQVAYPQATTRVSSNDRFIHAANHPEWYRIAAAAEEGMLRYLSEERLRQIYGELLAAPESSTPMHAYGYAIMQGVRDYCRVHLADHPEMVRVLDNATATVFGNLAKVIFPDPLLFQRAHGEADFQFWASNLAAFDRSDVFTHRPPEQGRDVDGITKPVIEMCPCPRLGRHLVHVGYDLMLEYLSSNEGDSGS